MKVFITIIIAFLFLKFEIGALLNIFLRFISNLPKIF